MFETHAPSAAAQLGSSTVFQRIGWNPPCWSAQPMYIIPSCSSTINESDMGRTESRRESRSYNELDTPINGFITPSPPASWIVRHLDRIPAVNPHARAPGSARPAASTMHFAAGSILMLRRSSISRGTMYANAYTRTVGGFIFFQRNFRECFFILRLICIHFSLKILTREKMRNKLQ